MNKIYITNHVKSEILNVCGLSSMQPYNLNGFTPLATLGYSSIPHCRILEDRLQYIASFYNTGKMILPDSVSENFTVTQCVELVFDKAYTDNIGG